jgi:HSP20 family protein
VDLPGVPKEEINIEVNEDQLFIMGEHKGVEGFESASSRVRERRIGKFRKIVRLPSGTDAENIKARYDNGLLEVKVIISSQWRTSADIMFE